MVRALTLSIAIFGVASAPAEGQLIEKRAGWTILRHSDSCGMGMEFEGPGSTKALLNKNSEGELFIAISNSDWSAKKDRKYSISFLVNGVEYSGGDAIGYEDSYVRRGFLTKLAPSFEKNFAAGSSLNVYLGDQRIDQLSLKGTAAALQAVNGCLTKVRAEVSAEKREKARWAHLPKDPFAGSEGQAVASAQLNVALSRLSRSPRDLDALVDAGIAALVGGDQEASDGFFRRAEQISPSDPRVKAGLGAVSVQNGHPRNALVLFDEAEKAGAQTSILAADRGLAYDLMGENLIAQKLYRLALARTPNAEVTRRLALSQAISGDANGAESTLLPLLRDQDKAAWRTRTFALAILAQPEEAIRAAKTILPIELAESITPYLRFMPQLTRAQQASAAMLGFFPVASEIGRDSTPYRQAPIAAMPQGSAATDIAAPLRAAQAARSQPVGRRDEKFASLYRNWMSLEIAN